MRLVWFVVSYARSRRDRRSERLKIPAVGESSGEELFDGEVSDSCEVACKHDA